MCFPYVKYLQSVFFVLLYKKDVGGKICPWHLKNKRGGIYEKTSGIFKAL